MLPSVKILIASDRIKEFRKSKVDYDEQAVTIVENREFDYNRYVNSRNIS